MSTQLAVEDVAKLKVNDLKKELKARDLSITGNKNELVARLEQALRESGDDAVDEEALLEEEIAETTPDAAMKTAVKVVESKTPLDGKEKNELETKAAVAVKIGDKAEGDAEKLSKRQQRFGVKSEDGALESRKERFGIVTEDDKKQARAQKFGIQAKDDGAGGDSNVKKAQRTARFGLTKEADTKVTPLITTEEEKSKLLKRKERFGETVSPKVVKVEDEEKLTKRASRFGGAATITAPAGDGLDKKAQRAARFKV